MNRIEPMRNGRLTHATELELSFTVSVSKLRLSAELPVSGVLRNDVPEKTCGYLQSPMRQERPNKVCREAEATVGWRPIFESMKC